MIAWTFALVGLAAGAVACAVALEARTRSRRALLELARTRAAGPVTLELEPIYPNGASGALHRIELAELAGRDDVYAFPRGAERVRLRVVQRAGIYAGDTTTVDTPSEPIPPSLRRVK